MPFSLRSLARHPDSYDLRQQDDVLQSYTENEGLELSSHEGLVMIFRISQNDFQCEVEPFISRVFV